ncbi:hypothetical protein AB5I41_03405 [Sphingomonas sp. MMS24-JH45]
MAYTGKELRSTATDDGRLSLTLEEVTLDAPGADEVIVRVEAAPINSLRPRPAARPGRRLFAAAGRRGRVLRDPAGPARWRQGAARPVAAGGQRGRGHRGRRGTGGRGAGG